MDDVLIFCSGSRGETRALQDILDLFSKATGMEINFGKSTLTTHLLRPEEEAELRRLFPIISAGLDEGLKYLGFSLKANLYRKQDWMWLVGKVEKRLMVWSHKWLSRAGRLVLVKVVLEEFRFIGCHYLGFRKGYWRGLEEFVSDFSGVAKRMLR